MSLFIADAVFFPAQAPATALALIPFFPNQLPAFVPFLASHPVAFTPFFETHQPAVNGAFAVNQMLFPVPLTNILAKLSFPVFLFAAITIHLYSDFNYNISYFPNFLAYCSLHSANQLLILLMMLLVSVEEAEM